MWFYGRWCYYWLLPDGDSALFRAAVYALAQQNIASRCLVTGQVESNGQMTEMTAHLEFFGKGVERGVRRLSGDAAPLLPVQCMVQNLIMRQCPVEAETPEKSRASGYSMYDRLPVMFPDASSRVNSFR